MAYRFSQPALESDWKSYHDIRRTVLFEARGRFGVYQEGHPDESAAGNHPFLLFLDDLPIGAIRIDLPAGSNEAIFRRLAISTGHQRQGHGTTLMREAEAFAFANHRSTFVANVALDAIPFYEKLGYELAPASPHNDPANPRMVKIHSPSTPAPLIDATVYQESLADATEVAIHEGLPHPLFEKSLFERELQRPDATTIAGFPFYSPPEVLAEPSVLQALLADPAAIHPFTGEKLCGGFHPDYTLSWQRGPSTFHALICFNCGEVMFVSDAKKLRFELSGHVCEQLKKQLASMARKKPPTTSGYRVVFCEVDTGIVLKLDGTRSLNRPHTPPVFETIEQARTFAEDILKSIPHGEAWIGQESDPQYEHLLSPHYPAYEREKRHLEFWLTLPFWRRWFTPRPQLTLPKPPAR
jgi:GNAT superfamily N-acetyltransferase